MEDVHDRTSIRALARRFDGSVVVERVRRVYDKKAPLVYMLAAIRY